MHATARMTDDEVAVGKMYKIITPEGIVIVRVTERRLVKDWKTNYQEFVWLYIGLNMKTGKIRVFRVGVVRRETGFAPQQPKKRLMPGDYRRVNRV